MPYKAPDLYIFKSIVVILHFSFSYNFFNVQNLKENIVMYRLRNKILRYVQVNVKC